MHRPDILTMLCRHAFPQGSNGQVKHPALASNPKDRPNKTRYWPCSVPFPPGPQDPQTLHKLIWDEFDEGVPFGLPADEPLLLASYRAAVPVVEFTPEAFIEPFRVGAELPDMPAWLDADLYDNIPLEKTCVSAGNCARRASDTWSSTARCRMRT
jgi:hypothetical protein